MSLAATRRTGRLRAAFFIAIALLLSLPAAARAQGVVTQLGIVTPGQMAQFVGNGRVVGSPLSMGIAQAPGVPITKDGAIWTLQTDKSVLANSIYGSGGAVCKGCVVYDGLRSVASVPFGSTVTAVNAIAGYIANHTPTVGGGGNAVALFGGYYSDADNSTTWGINTTGQDSNSYVIGSGVGRQLVAYEADLTIVNPLSQVNGISLLGSSLVQPAYAQGFVVGSLSVQDRTIAKWTHSFVSTAGVSNEAFYAGALAASGTNIASQPILINYFNSAGVAKTYTIQANTLGGLSINGSDTSPSIGTNGIINGNSGQSIFYGNRGSAYPSSVTTGYAISSNFATARDTDIWNTDTAATTSFNFYQKIGASAGTLVASLAPGVLQIPGLPSSAGSGGLYACVDNTGVAYLKSACP